MRLDFGLLTVLATVVSFTNDIAQPPSIPTYIVAFFGGVMFGYCAVRTVGDD